jgi:hypothetical protein
VKEIISIMSELHEPFPLSHLQIDLDNSLQFYIPHFIFYCDPSTLIDKMDNSSSSISYEGFARGVGGKWGAFT